jgi:hypothetical protein
MNNLIKSYKFWCALIASLVIMLVAKVGGVGDGVLMSLIGLWSVVIGGKAWADANKIKNG